ncbi:MAG: hypothetical protein GX324_10445 [Aeromonadales bacterium]|nr:hypothetical protein [Aeromonadales bacterium]
MSSLKGQFTESSCAGRIQVMNSEALNVENRSQSI